MESISAVTAALKDSYAAICKPQEILVGLSGGADSVALLVSLCEMRAEYNLMLYAVHVNHGLRESASLDEDFCIRLCERLKVPLTVKRVSGIGYRNVEACAREARYAAFDAVMRDCGASVLALAHHMDDQAETVLLHLMHGAGSTGLGGMRMLNGYIWRPFLSLSRRQLRAYLTERQHSWREDESNADPAYTRNRIRSEVLPAMAKCCQDPAAVISRSAGILRDEDDCLNALADTWLEKNGAKAAFHFVLTDTFDDLHIAVQRRVVRKLAERASLHLDFQQTERLRLLALANPGGTENLPGDSHALKTKKRLHIIREDSRGLQTPVGDLLIADADAADTALSHLLPKGLLNSIELRTRRPGDYIRPFGMQGKKSLTDYMTDRGVDGPFRDSWPIVCAGCEVLWVIGIGASERLRVHKGEPAKKMMYSGALPDQI